MRIEETVERSEFIRPSSASEARRSWARLTRLAADGSAASVREMSELLRDKKIDLLHLLGSEAGRRLVFDIVCAASTLRAVKCLRHAGADLEVCHPETRRTPLENAIDLGNIAHFTSLLAAGACVTQEAFFAAVANGVDPVFVRELVKRKADFYHLFLDIDDVMASAVREAVQNSAVEPLKELVRAGAPVVDEKGHGMTLVERAILRQSLPVVKVLLEAGADPNAGSAPLVRAVESSAEGIAKLLLDHGADPDARNPFHGETALYIAVTRGLTGIVRVLLDHGADPLAGNRDGRTPFDAAKSGELRELLTKAVHEKMSVEQMPNEGVSKLSGEKLDRVLFAAAKDGNIRKLSGALSAGADPDVRDDFGNTPLHWAARMGHKQCAKALLKSGADLDAKNNDDETALHHAAWHDSDCVELLLKSGADPNAKNRYGETPLYHAVWYNRVNHMELLLAAGADPLVKNVKGEMPLDIARSGVVRKALHDAVRSKMSATGLPSETAPWE